MAGQVRILVVMANPPVPGKRNISVGLDCLTIQKRVIDSTYGDLIDIKVLPEPNARELQDDLLRVDPHVVHFACHGSPSGLTLRSLNDPFAGDELKTERLVELLQIPKSLRVAVFNSCETEAVGAAVLKNENKNENKNTKLDFVVTMRTLVTDAVATVFVSGFYLALGCGESVNKAMMAGRNEIGLRDPEGASIPALQIRNGKKAEADRPFTELVEVKQPRTGLIPLTPPTGMWPKNGFDYQVLEVSDGDALLNHPVPFEPEPKRNPTHLVARVLNAVNGLHYKCFVDLPDPAPGENELEEAFKEARWGPPEKNEQVARTNRRWFHRTERRQWRTTPDGYTNDYLPFDPP